MCYVLAHNAPSTRNISRIKKTGSDWVKYRTRLSLIESQPKKVAFVVVVIVVLVIIVVFVVVGAVVVIILSHKNQTSKFGQN